jgi:UDP:flavonoid glycosyltransferase YjiC (YdhE family)
MPDRGHFQRLRPLVSDLLRRQARVVVFTHARFGSEVAADGAEFVDLFQGRSIDQPEDDSWPPAIRYVTFAATYAAEVREHLESLGATLVVYDTFAVVGAVAAQLLGRPRVNMCAGHAVVPERFLDVLRSHPRMRVSASCERAIERLRSEHRVEGVSPFSYVTALSPDLNVYSEPPPFLSPADRPHFEPVAFYGSLTDAAAAGLSIEARSRASRRWFGNDAERALKVYASFGTAIWEWRSDEAIRALMAVSEWATSRPDVRVLITLGGTAIRRTDVGQVLGRANVRVAPFVDQGEALAGADVFLTHHGLNSTHEAIASEVPMLSYPFIWDQPGLAARCRDLGLAEPLVETPMAAPTPLDVASAFDRLAARRPLMARALREARQWESDVVGARPAVIDRILALGA